MGFKAGDVKKGDTVKWFNGWLATGEERIEWGEAIRVSKKSVSVSRPERPGAYSLVPYYLIRQVAS